MAQTAAPVTTQEQWQARASAFLKAKMKECGVTYTGLVERLRAHGFEETEASITMKLKRGTFAATFLLACLAALELEGMKLADLAQDGSRPVQSASRDE